MTVFRRPPRSDTLRLPRHVMQAAAALLCVFSLVLWAPRALAHASLLASEPAAGTVLQNAPPRARLIFNEPVSPLVLNIIQPDGSSTKLTQIQAMPDGLQVALPTLAQQGAYALSWRVVSADGHPIGGTVVFSIGTGGAPAPDKDVSASSGREVLIWLARMAWYAGLFMGVGAAAFGSFISFRSDARRIRIGGLLLGGLATPACLGLLGIDALDMPFSGLLSLHAWRTALQTSFGLSAALSLAALASAAATGWVSTIPVRQWLAGMAVLLLGAALASSGHASVAPPQWLARPSVWLHGVAVALWIGSLLPLAAVLRATPALAPLQRFSRTVPWVVLCLAASGATLACLQMDGVSSLWQAAYGQILLAKLALLTLLLGLAAYNRYRLTKAVLRADTDARRSLRAIIYAECTLALAILGVVALWRFTPPPRALHPRLPAPQAVSMQTLDAAAIAKLTLMPAAAGRPAELHIRLFNAKGAPMRAQEVEVVFSSPASGIEPIVFVAQHQEDGRWQARPVELPYQATWHVRVNVLVSDFERISLETVLNRSGW